MFRVVIAEDSKPIARNIKQLIERSELPLQVVHTAYNGEEAFAYIQSHHADILLTDIRMPKLDGLALIERLKPDFPNLKVVLISSYSDFEYTRKAINLHVFDYLLKPVEQQQLEDVMQRIAAQLQEMQASRQTVLGDIIGEERLAYLQLGPEFFDQPKLVMMLCRQPFSSDERWEYEYLQRPVMDSCSPYATWLLPLKRTGVYLLLASVLLKEKFETGSAWMADVHERLRKSGLLASAVCLFEPIEAGRLHQAYHDMESFLHRELTLFEPALKELDQTHTRLRDPDESLHMFAEMIQHRQKEQYMLKLSERLKYMKSANANWSELEALLSTIDAAFQAAWKEVSSEEAHALEEERPLIEKLDLSGYDTFSAQLLDWSEDQFQRLQALNRKSGDELFGQMDQYIQQQIYAQLAINDLAHMFHVSPSYVSRIIKRFTGLTFVQYFTKLKIEEACRLLQAKPGLKIRALSDALSFSDQHYFSRVFKDYTGLSPTEYKDKLPQDGDGME